ncbi:MAG: class I SAM-dependent RNA methyltransferase [Gemmatimonadaceae bacterium]
MAAFATSAPGLEPIVAAELNRLRIQGEVEPGGVAWSGSIESVARANLWLRAASRVLVRVGQFRARTFWELERHARKLTWERFVAAGAPVRFRVTSRKSRLYHSDAVAERLANAAVARAGAAPSAPASRVDGPAGTRDDDDVYDEHDVPGQLFVVRVVRDVCTVSADASGALLHRRGYRQAVVKAPLRETIAAAMLLGSEWRGTAPLIDPMCGSGTIPIEAALIARRIAPGLGREFAFERWPDFEGVGWARMREAARERQLSRAPVPIRASDRDPGAVEAALANAERAGVAADVELDVRPVSGVEPPARRGWVVTNPPYGVRVGETTTVRDLYAALGDVLRARFRGWTLALLSPGGSLEHHVGVALRQRFATVNGGIPVRLMTGEVTQ